jgi:hypothetical protein
VSTCFTKEYEIEETMTSWRVLKFVAITQSVKLGLIGVFFCLYQYQYWSSAGQKVVLFVARKTSLGFYWYFKKQVFAETGFIPTSGL